MYYRRLVISMLGFYLIYVENLSDAVVFKFTNAVCESYNRSWVTINTCRLKAIKRDRSAFNFNGTFIYPAYDIQYDAQLFKRANGYKPWLYKVHIDCCRFKRKPYNPLVIIFYNMFKNFSNFNHTCPYVGDQILDGFYLQPELLRLPFPTGDYLMSIRWYLEKKLQFDTNLSFQFIEDLRNT